MFEYKINNDISLKPLRFKDATDFYNLINRNRDYLKEWLTWVDKVKEVNDSREFIKFTLKQAQDDMGFQAAIWYKGSLAGVIGFYNYNHENREASIGYWIGEEFRGKGIMSRTTKAIVNYGFTEMNLNRIEIRCAEYNLASQSIPKKLGFTQEGFLREIQLLRGEFINQYVYGLLAKEWSM